MKRATLFRHNGFTDAEIGRRKPVWKAVSDLWLDTELDRADLEGIVRVLKESGFSQPELETIYRREVAPAVYTNLLVPAGEWAGFDEEWLYSSILKNIRSDNIVKSIFRRLIRRMMFYATRELWEDILRQLSDGK